MNNLSILLVDDSESDFIIVQELLRKTIFHSSTITWVEDANKALDVAQRGDYDLYIVDYLLGLDSGTEYIRGLRNLGITKPALLLTGMGNYEIDKEALAAGASDYWDKNQLTSEILERMIRYAVEQYKRELHTVELEKKVQTENKQKSLERMASGIAHDLNNAFSIIQGNVAILQEQMKESRFEKHFSAIHAALERSASLGQGLAAYVGVFQSETKILELSGFLEHSKDLLENLLPSSITLSIEKTEGLLEVSLNEAELLQVIMDLFNNACEAMGGKGKITLSLTAEYVSGTIEGGSCFPKSPEMGPYARLSIKDTGCGIAREDIAFIFDPFFSSKSFHRGLGLTTILGIVKKYQGYVHVTSKANTGSQFDLWFPLVGKNVSLLDNMGDKRVGVLVIDDEEAIVEMTEIVLDENGYDVYKAYDGKQGLEVYQKNKESISLIIMDINMPEMAGSELLQELREVNPEVKVMIMSGMYQSSEIAEEVQTGNVIFLQKPFKMDKMLTSIANFGINTDKDSASC